MARPSALLRIAILTACFPSIPAALPAQYTFVRGDFNEDGEIDIADPVFVLLHLFGGAPGTCHDAGDANDDGQLDIADAVHGLGFLFLGGPPPAPPFPECGGDPTLDPLDCGKSRRCPLVKNEIVAIRHANAGIEIELSSSMPFPVRALPAVLCIGEQGFYLSRPGSDGSLYTIIFALTADEFVRLRDGDLVTIQHGGCTEDLTQLRPFWDLWIFGPFDSSLLER